MADFFDQVTNECKITPVYEAQENVEVTRRVNEKETTIFVLNHNQTPSWVDFGEDSLTNLVTKETKTGRCEIADVMYGF